MIRWAAGLFEGEGCLDYGCNGLRARLGMTDEDVVRKFHEILGFGRVHSRVPGTGLKRMYTWCAFGKNVVSLVDRFRPYLGIRRLDTASRLLQQYEGRVSNNPEWRRQHTQMMRAARKKWRP